MVRVQKSVVVILVLISLGFPDKAYSGRRSCRKVAQIDTSKCSKKIKDPEVVQKEMGIDPEACVRGCHEACRRQKDRLLKGMTKPELKKFLARDLSKKHRDISKGNLKRLRSLKKCVETLPACKEKALATCPIADFRSCQPTKEKFGFPLQITRVLSTVKHRLHPITGTMKWHYGTDFRVKTIAPEKRQVHVYGRGKVLCAGCYGGYGYYVEVQHPDGWVSSYAHLDDREEMVKPGDEVVKGQVIGMASNTGRVEGPHLHMEVYCNNFPVNMIWAIGHYFERHEQLPPVPETILIKDPNTKTGQ